MIWEGLYFASTGYAEAARHYAFALDDLGVPITISPIDALDAPARRRLPEAARIVRLERREPHAGEVHVQHMMPPRYHPRKGPRANVGYTVFETDRLPRSWIPACNAMDEVWVPSQFCAEHFARAGVRRSAIQVIPHGVEVGLYRPEAAPLRIDGVRGFVFLSVFYWCNRKGWDVLLRAYLSEFCAADEVSLVIRSQGIDPREFRLLVDSEFPGSGRARVLVIPFPLPQAWMPGLYAAADAFVVPARGEGWGMPYSEAMATGLPTIATNWGGHLEFMTRENSYLVDVARMVPIDAWMRRATGAEDDHLWAEPSVDHLRATMRRVFEDREEAKRVGRAARRTIAGSFTWRHAAARICERAQVLGEFGRP